MSIDLRKYCHTNNDLQDDFVGIRIINGELQICFPLGFDIVDEANIKTDIRKLILTLIDFNKTHIHSKQKGDIEQLVLSDLPINAYQNIIDYFFLNGYYVEKKSHYSKASKGKINFSKTIKKIKPITQNGNAIYTNFQVKKEMKSEEELISLINKYCVYKAFLDFGFIFSNFKPQRISMPTDKRMCISILNNKLKETFDDRKRVLFDSMKKVLLQKDHKTKGSDFRFGTYHFHIIWEQMIDRIFGIKNKEKYFPSTTWHLSSREKPNHPLQPDTVMMFNDKIYVLDAKYYKFGTSKNANDLPNSSSIVKQISYAEYIQKLNRKAKIHNAFLLPYNKYKNCFNFHKNFENFGYALGEWRDNNISFEYIQGILVDTRFLIENYTKKSESIFYELADSIENSLENPHSSLS